MPNDPFRKQRRDGVFAMSRSSPPAGLALGRDDTHDFRPPSRAAIFACEKGSLLGLPFFVSGLNRARRIALARG